MNGKLVFAVVGASLGSGFVHGYQAGLLNILSAVINKWYSDVQKRRHSNEIGYSDVTVMGPFLVATFSLGGILGSLLIALCANTVGRKGGLLLSNTTVLIALLIMSFARFLKSYELFAIGRILIGMCAGLNSGLCPMYLIEIAPDEVRGAVGSAYYVAVAFGIFCAYIFTLPEILGTKDTWAFIFVIAVLPTVVQLIMLAFCPESPKFLYINKEDEDEAEDALAWLRGEDIDEDLEDLREEAAALREIGDVHFSTLFKEQTVRTPLIIGTVILLGQQVCGADVILFFSTAIIYNFDFSLRYAVNCTIGLGAVTLVTSIISMCVVDQVGRKNLLFISFGGMFFISLCLTLSLFLKEADDIEGIKHVTVAFLFVFVIMYGIGAGTISWFHTSELCNHLARPMSVTIAVTLNWLTNFILIMSWLPILGSAGNFSFIMFIIFNLIIVAFISMTMRETMALSSVDLLELFYE